MALRKSTLRTSTPVPFNPSPPDMFSTLITRSPVNSRLIFSLPLVRSVLPPMVPSTSKALVAAAIGTACKVTCEPPSSKLDW